MYGSSLSCCPSLQPLPSPPLPCYNSVISIALGVRPWQYGQRRIARSLERPYAKPVRGGLCVGRDENVIDRPESA